ncbi:MAG: alpha/beta fold hydrolase [Pseudomonadales bacterium]|nr:alpha/beta fold hydrolase [Pseudomonadales bacterium]
MQEIFRQHKALLLSLILIFSGGLLAWLVQTGAGQVELRDTRFNSASGATLSALLYVPEGVNANNPAPGVLAVHGYINSRETQSAYAIELARRGYVVLAMDQRGHGYSDPPAFAEGFGGPAGLAYLRSLEFVDPNQVVLSGHSMGGWTVLSAAVAMPDAYTSVVVSGSSTGTFGVPPGDASFPRNFGLVFGQFDEFSPSMWSSATGAGIVDTEKLQNQFGVSETVQPDRLYGSIAEGTARQLYQPAQTHPANHITRSGVAGALDWVQRTTSAPNPIPADQQIWPWKELGTFLSLLGGILFLISAGPALLQIPLFRQLAASPAPSAGIRDRGWYLAAVIVMAIPALTYFSFQGWAAVIPSSALFAQNLTNGFMVWALGNAVISLLLFSLWHFALGGRAGGGNGHNYGLLPGHELSLRKLALSLLLALTVVFSLYLLLAIVHGLFTADFRYWVIAVKLMNGLQFRLFLGYLLPFTAFFLVFALILHGQMRRNDAWSFARAAAVNAALAGGGILALLLYQYGALFVTGSLAIPSQALLTIVALQFVVLLPIAAIISTRYFMATGQLYVGAFINGLFVTWLIVAGQATHYAF